MEQISYVIVDQSSLIISAFSTTGKQVNLQFTNDYELVIAVQRCAAWLPNNRILMTI